MRERHRTWPRLGPWRGLMLMVALPVVAVLHLVDPCLIYGHDSDQATSTVAVHDVVAATDHDHGTGRDCEDVPHGVTRLQCLAPPGDPGTLTVWFGVLLVVLSAVILRGTAGPRSRLRDARRWTWAEPGRVAPRGRSTLLSLCVSLT